MKYFLLFVFFGFGVALSGGASWPYEYIYNPDFEDLVFTNKGKDWPANCTDRTKRRVFRRRIRRGGKTTYITMSTQKYFEAVQDASVAKSGEVCIKAVNTAGGIMQLVVNGFARSLKKYAVSFWIKGGDRRAKVRCRVSGRCLPKNSRKWIKFKPKNEGFPIITPTAQWKKHTGTVTIMRDAQRFSVYIEIYFWSPRGGTPVFIDGISMTEIK